MSHNSKEATPVVQMVFGSGRFGGAVANNVNELVVGDFDRPTKLVDSRKDVALCLPQDLELWGLYPTHQEAWLCLFFVVACHAHHEDEVGLALRQAAWEKIPEFQWQALAAKAVEFASEFRTRLEVGGLCERKLYKSLTRALQDCVLYLAGRETFPADQDRFLRESAVAGLVAQANRGRAGELTLSEGLELANQVDALVAGLVEKLGGLEACRAALGELAKLACPSRVILLPEGMSLARGAELVEFDLVIGTPDEHDMDVVSVCASQTVAGLVQLHDVLSGQRMDIMAVPANLGPEDQLQGGHPAFQSVAEMLLANGTPVTSVGSELVARLASQVDPMALAEKYEHVARDFFAGSHRKSWAGRRADPSVAQVKKVIPLYRIACDLLPRAAYLRRTGKFPGGLDIAELAEAAAAGLGEAFLAIRGILDRQDATDAELASIAKLIEAHLS